MLFGYEHMGFVYEQLEEPALCAPKQEVQLELLGACKVSTDQDDASVIRRNMFVPNKMSYHEACKSMTKVLNKCDEGHNDNNRLPLLRTIASRGHKE